MFDFFLAHWAGGWWCFELLPLSMTITKNDLAPVSWCFEAATWKRGQEIGHAIRGPIERQDCFAGRSAGMGPGSSMGRRIGHVWKGYRQSQWQVETNSQRESKGQSPFLNIDEKFEMCRRSQHGLRRKNACVAFPFTIFDKVIDLRNQKSIASSEHMINIECSTPFLKTYHVPTFLSSANDWLEKSKSAFCT